MSRKPSKRGKRLVWMKIRAPNKIQTQKGSIQEMEAEIGDPEENRDTEHAGAELRKSKPIWSEIWQVT